MCHSMRFSFEDWKPSRSNRLFLTHGESEMRSRKYVHRMWDEVYEALQGSLISGTGVWKSTKGFTVSQGHRKVCGLCNQTAYRSRPQHVLFRSIDR
jgi:hypothetical protein